MRPLLQLRLAAVDPLHVEDQFLLLPAVLDGDGQVSLAVRGRQVRLEAHVVLHAVHLDLGLAAGVPRPSAFFVVGKVRKTIGKIGGAAAVQIALVLDHRRGTGLHLLAHGDVDVGELAGADKILGVQRVALHLVALQAIARARLHQVIVFVPYKGPGPAEQRAGPGPQHEEPVPVDHHVRLVARVLGRALGMDGLDGCDRDAQSHLRGVDAAAVGARTRRALAGLVQQVLEDRKVLLITRGVDVRYIVTRHVEHRLVRLDARNRRHQRSEHSSRTSCDSLFHLSLRENDNLHPGGPKTSLRHIPAT